MAITHITYNSSTTGGSRIRSITSGLTAAQDALAKELATIVTLCDNSDASSAANFTAATSYYGYGSNADAKASYDELNSLNSKINSDGSVSAVMTAIKQADNKHR